jgi:hypothetical protein
MAEISDLNVTDSSNIARFPEGMSPGAVNDGARALEGILARWFKDTNGSLSSSGSSNAFAVTSNRTISSLVDGTRLSFKANHSITGAATLNLNGLGAKDIKRFNGSALSSGDIISGQPVDVIYSSSLDDWIMISALAALVGSTHADFGENGSPGNPAADTGRLYAFDDGGTTVIAWRDSAGVVSPLRVATQAEMEAPDDNRIVRADRQHFHPGHAKAWGLVATDGTLTAGYNIASSVRNSTGNYSITFTNAMNGSYAVVMCPASGPGNAERTFLTPRTANGFTAIFQNASGAAADCEMHFSVFGDM